MRMQRSLFIHRFTDLFTRSVMAVLFFLVFIALTPASVFAAESDVVLMASQQDLGSIAIRAKDPIDKGFVGELSIKIWSAKNSQDDIKTYPLSYAGGLYSATVNIADHQFDKGIYYIELHGPSGLLKSDFTMMAVEGNEWDRYIYHEGKVVGVRCRAVLSIEPEIIKNSTEEANSSEQFKSGYGYTTTFKSNVVSNIEVDASTALTGAGNARVIFPEFNYRDGSTINTVYGQFDRLTDCTNRSEINNLAGSVLELKENPFSSSNKRVHFTPIWYPDNLNYTAYTDVFDAWTPGGMLSMPVLDSFTVDGNVYDDWQVNQKR